MIGSVTMNNESRVIAHVSTSGMLWTTWNLEDHRHRIVYATSEFSFDNLLHITKTECYSVKLKI